MEKLFLVSVGGKALQANIEVHDLLFVIGETIEATYEQIQTQWFGIKEGLHIDSYKVIDYIEGYQVEAKDYQQDNVEQLFLIYFGGHDKSLMQEVHYYKFLVAKDLKEAKSKATSLLERKMDLEHIDNIVDVKKCINDQYYIHLTASEVQSNLKPDWYGFKKL